MIVGGGRVEFYLDDELQETLTSAPYEWIWEGTENHLVKAIVYDYADIWKRVRRLVHP